MIKGCVDTVNANGIDIQLFQEREVASTSIAISQRVDERGRFRKWGVRIRKNNAYKREKKTIRSRLVPSDVENGPCSW